MLAEKNKRLRNINNSTGSYCRRFFKNIYIEKYGAGHVKISPCCISGAHDEIVDSVDFHTNEILVRQRQQSRDGIRVPECTACWNREDQGFLSQRDTNQRHDAFKVELHSIEYNVSPICNARCIICSSRFSSAWAQEDEQFGIPIDAGRKFGNVRSNSVDIDLDLSAVNSIYFNGGEPMLSPEPTDMLRRILKAKGTLSNVAVSLNTNGSIMPDEETVTLWQQCRSLVLNFSIDACGQEFHYIRFPLQWSSVVNNLAGILDLKLPQVNLCVATVVGIHNFLELPVLHDWILSVQDTHNLSWGLHPAFGPFGLNNISDALKDKIRSTPLSIKQTRFVRSFVDHPRSMPSETYWLDRLETIDQRRGLDWRTSLPKLAQLLG